MSVEFKVNANTSRIDLWSRKLKNPPMGEVAAIGERLHRQFFAEQAGPDGGWAPLSASTLRTKRSGVILRETSALVGGISSSASAKSARIFSAGPFYNVFHQAGTSKMPARKFIGIRPGQEEQYLQPLKRWIGGF